MENEAFKNQTAKFFKSPYINRLNHDVQHLPYHELYPDTLFRLPFCFGISDTEQQIIIDSVNFFYSEK